MAKDSMLILLFMFIFFVILFFQNIIIGTKQEKYSITLEPNNITHYSKRKLFEKILSRYIAYKCHKNLEQITNLLSIINLSLLANGLFEKRYLFYSIAIIESCFDPSASSKVAYGLFQINFEANKDILKRLGVTDPLMLHNPALNVESAIQIFLHIKSYLIKQNKYTLIKLLNVYSGDSSGEYALKVISLAEELKYIFNEEVLNE